MPDPTDISPDTFDTPPPEEIEDPKPDEPLSPYDPSEIEVTRGREQGLGVGARDLARQRDVHTGDDVGDDGGTERLDPSDPRYR